ncbi:MAG: bifunctional riboflavin kinase/FAD synthetase [Chloroflexota bacterium]
MVPSLPLSINPPAAVPPDPTVITIGVFDGVHLGHRALIQATVERAHTLGIRSAAITFDPHPRAVLGRGEAIQYLNSLSERIDLIRSLGVDTVAVLRFSLAVAGLSAEAFVRELKAQMGLAELWVGPDFALGKGRQGTVPVLRELGTAVGFAVETVPPVVVDGEVVSSSLIRRLLLAGDVEAAAILLSRPYTLEGIVAVGDRRGRTLGFPTANLPLAPERVAMANGVYVVRAHSQGRALPAVASIGVRPTFGLNERGLEVFIMDFADDLYGQPLRVEFLRRLRPELQFDSIDALVAQMQRDVADARAYFCR